MQVVAYREETIPSSILTRENEQIRHFSLSGIMPAGYSLALNIPLGTLSCLSSSDGEPRLVIQQQFTTSELSVLLPILTSFPYYCPYEELFASFYNGTVTEILIEDCRQRLQDALDTGNWEQQMRPIRNVLSRVRIKMRAFGVNISPILETGYMLKAAPSPDAMAASA
ncbi:MAG: hypothetical protein M3Y81_24710 [Chloroflexota bacterium]|nr:hypothetical protein [Chloroflexota bacterium]